MLEEICRHKNTAVAKRTEIMNRFWIAISLPKTTTSRLYLEVANARGYMTAAIAWYGRI